VIAGSAVWVFHRPMGSIVAVPGSSTEGNIGDTGELVGRIIQAYNIAIGSFAGPGDSMWRKFFDEKHSLIHQYLISRNAESVAEFLRDPASNSLFHGFDPISLVGTNTFKDNEIQRKGYAARVYDSLRRLCEAIGAIDLEYPEQYPISGTKIVAVDSLLEALDKSFGFRVDFPNPFPQEYGLATPRGIVGHRTTHALYQAWKIRELTSKIARPSVVEIGAGLGRTAYYSYRLGITDYTIVDLPITNVSQAYFLGVTLGRNRVALHGEDRDRGDVAIIPPEAFQLSSSRIDLVLNSDSLTEMSESFANSYFSIAAKRSQMLLSINHEFNRIKIRNLMAACADVHNYSRYPYWMRRGYVEELVTF